MYKHKNASYNYFYIIDWIQLCFFHNLKCHWVVFHSMNQISPMVLILKNNKYMKASNIVFFSDGKQISYNIAILT